MAYVQKTKVGDYIYLRLMESYWDKDAKKYRKRVLENLGRIETMNNIPEYAIIWSEEHTLGHIAIEAGNDLLLEIPEGTGDKLKLPCQFVEAGKFRNGKPRMWCRTHQSHYGRKADRGQCSNAHIAMNYCRNPFVFNTNDYPGGIAIWSAALPAICTRPDGATEEAGIHVHARMTPTGKKVIDKTFSALSIILDEPLKLSQIKIHVTPTAALAYLDAVVKERDLDVNRCGYCSTPHLDLGYFAQNAHRMHLCGNCGREFRVKETRVSNPLLMLSQYLEKKERISINAPKTLNINSRDYGGGLEVWSSTPAIVWTFDKPEEVGIHVHAYDSNDKRVIDDTFSEVVLDGIALSREELLAEMLPKEYLKPTTKNPFAKNPKDRTAA